MIQGGRSHMLNRQMQISVTPPLLASWQWLVLDEDAGSPAPTLQRVQVHEVS